MDHPRTTADTLLWVVLGWLLVLYLARIAPLDLDVFLRAGHDVWRGRDPYPDPDSPAVYSMGAFLYPYVAVLPFVALSWLPHGLAVAVYLLAGAGAVVWACRLAGCRGPAAPGLLLVASTTLIGFQMGAVNPFLLLGLVAMWRYRDRPGRVGMVFALVVVAKLFLAPVALWLLATRRWAALGWSAAVSVALLATGFLIGPFGPGRYVRLLSAFEAHAAGRGYSLTGLLRGAMSGLSTRTVVLAAVAAVVAAGWWWGRRDERIAYAAAVTAALLLSPVVWSHYYLVLAAPLLVLARPERGLAGYAIGTWLMATPHESAGLANELHPLRYCKWPVALALLVLPVAAAWLASRPVRRPAYSTGGSISSGSLLSRCATCSTTTSLTSVPRLERSMARASSGRR
jgi:hypothetical protein